MLLLSRDALAALLVCDEARLGLEGGGAGRANSEAGLEEMLATLALRTGARGGGCEGEATTDCRFVVKVADLGFGAMTLAGRGRGAVAGGLTFGVAARCGVDGGAGWEIILVMLESRMNKPWPGGQLK